MTFLAIFSAFFLPLTLITSFYWMNIKLPFEKNEFIVYNIIFIISIIMVFIYFVLKKKWKL
jgi:Mg2+ and Co2+ transporter CorA